MALQKDIEFDNGIILDDAYIKITSILIEYTAPPILTIKVSIYKNVASYAGGKPAIERLEYKCTDPEYTTYFANEKFENFNPQALAYEYLKTLPFYSGAISL